MPSHTYMRIGRFADAIESSLRAIHLDTAYTKQCLVPYVPSHNVAMLVMAAMASGREVLALEHAGGIMQCIVRIYNFNIKNIAHES